MLELIRTEVIKCRLTELGGNLSLHDELLTKLRSTRTGKGYPPCYNL